MSATCVGCGRVLVDGASAWADDWKVLTPQGWRAETRYTCDSCSSEGER